MQKKSSKKQDKTDFDNDLLNDDLLDDDLLSDDLDNDPLLKEAASLLGVPIEKSVKQTEAKSKVNKQIKPTLKITKDNMKQGNSPAIEESTELEKLPIKKSKLKPVINKKTMTEFAQYLIKSEKIYEEISFQTILRKIPKDWNYDEEILIDVLEVLIEKHTIPSFDMKMTRNSLKFYPLGSKHDIKKLK